MWWNPEYSEDELKKHDYKLIASIMKTETKCGKAGCELDSDNAVHPVPLLQVDIITAYVTGPAQQDGNSNGKPGKAKQPEMSAEMSEVDWEYFLPCWENHKIASIARSPKLTGGEAVIIQLMECAVERLRRDRYRIYSEGDGLTTGQDILVRKFFGLFHGGASVCGHTASYNKACFNKVKKELLSKGQSSEVQWEIIATMGTQVLQGFNARRRTTP